MCSLEGRGGRDLEDEGKSEERKSGGKSAGDRAGRK
jgi:hypothetical protein